MISSKSEKTQKIGPGEQKMLDIDFVFAANNDDLKSCERLIGLGANPNGTSISGQHTLLHIAAMNAQEDLCLFLIRSGADVNARGDDGNSVLQSLVPKEANNLFGKVHAALIAAKADINARNDHGQAYIDNVCSCGDVDLFKGLVKLGIDYKYTNGYGYMPIHIAAAWGRGALCKEMISMGVDPNVLTGDGQTPLFLAAGHGETQTCFDLIMNGADPTMKFKGRTPWGQAGSKKKKETAKNLRAFVDSLKASKAIELALATPRAKAFS